MSATAKCLYGFKHYQRNLIALFNDSTTLSAFAIRWGYQCRRVSLHTSNNPANVNTNASQYLRGDWDVTDVWTSREYAGKLN